MLSKSFINLYTYTVVKRNLSKNHYNTLNLPKDCSKKDIKQAFLKLSKLHHPDKNTNKDSHDKYVAILEAYKVLSRPFTRRLHDLELGSGYSHGHQNDPSMASPFWEHRDKNQDKFYETKAYYGIKGINKKVPNSWIVLFCFAIATLGVTAQLVTIRHSYTLRREEMIKKSDDLVILHSKIREQALRNGNSLQLELLKRNLGVEDTEDEEEEEI